MAAPFPVRLALVALVAGTACGCATQHVDHGADVPPTGSADVSTADAAPAQTTQQSEVPAAPADPAQAFVDNALAMLGQPYRYGGDEPGGFDCSGLVNYAARGVGVSLPRTTDGLARIGRRVPPAALQTGDLLFFRDTGGKQLHVGIYLGDENFVHAPSSGRVVTVDELDSPYYARHFWQARRLNLP